jgi:hypothetical protein
MMIGSWKCLMGPLGTAGPDFRLPDVSGKIVALADFSGEEWEKSGMRGLRHASASRNSQRGS